MAGELWKPLLLSTLAHVSLFAGLLMLAPYLSSSRPAQPPAQMVQLVDLPGGGGPGGRPSAEAPPATAKKPEPPPQPAKPAPPKAETPPAKPQPAAEKVPPKPKAAEPEMALPSAKPKPAPKREPPHKEEKRPEPSPPPAAEKPKGPEPSRPRPFDTAAKPAREPAPGGKPGAATGPGPGTGGGLALGSGSGLLSLDTANFPFTYYLRQVTNRIEENWIRPQGNLGRVIVYFRIKRDGSIVEPQIYESSRSAAVDMLAAGAIKRSEPFPPLPVEYGGDYLGIYLCFGMGSACPGQREG
jgi:outer membrane biosynthesis protein TonB